MILVPYWKVHTIIQCIYIFQITSHTVNFSLIQIIIWILTYIFEIFIVFDIKLFSSFSTNVFQLFSCTVGNSLRFLTDKNCQKILYHQKTTCKCLWLWYLIENMMKIFAKAILLKSRVMCNCLRSILEFSVVFDMQEFL